jgi:hypothetical protein
VAKIVSIKLFRDGSTPARQELLRHRCFCTVAKTGGLVTDEMSEAVVDQTVVTTRVSVRQAIAP